MWDGCSQGGSRSPGEGVQGRSSQETNSRNCYRKSPHAERKLCGLMVTTNQAQIGFLSEFLVPPRQETRTQAPPKPAFCVLSKNLNPHPTKMKFFGLVSRVSGFLFHRPWDHKFREPRNWLGETEGPWASRVVWICNFFIVLSFRMRTGNQVRSTQRIRQSGRSDCGQKHARKRHR